MSVPTSRESQDAEPSRRVLPVAEPQWVELALFYALTRRLSEDPAEVVDRGVILYGEGLATDKEQKDALRRENLGDGLHVLHVTGSWSSVRNTLLQPHFDHRHSNGKKTRFRMDFIERPPIVGRPTKMGVIGSAGPVFLFVRKGKADHIGDLDDRGALLARLESLVERQFRSDDVAWLGDVAVMSQPRGSVWWQAIKSADRKAPCCAITLHRSPDLQDQTVQVNLRVSARDDAIIEDRLVTMPAQHVNAVEVDFNQPFARIHLRAWVAGVLIAEGLNVLIQAFAFSTSMGGGSVRLKDKLHEKLSKAAASSKSARTALETQTIAKREGSKIRSSTGVRQTDWDFARREVAEVFNVAPPSPAENTFFAVGVEGRVRAMNFFADTLSKAGRATIADPWFDADAASVLLPRLSTPTVDLTVVTSLPDDGRGLVADLKAMLAHLRPAQKVRFIRVTRDGGRAQAFHDRVVVVDVDGGEGPPRGLLLSNSFSGMASAHPLAVAELPRGTTAVFIDLIAGLIEGAQGVVVEQLWPTTQPPLSEPDPHEMNFFPTWRRYVAAILPGSRGFGGTTLSAAAKVGLLTLDVSGVPHWAVSERNRDRILDRLLPHRAPTGSRLRREGSVRHPRSPGVSDAILMLGEVRARGLACPVDDIFGRLGREHVAQIERALVSTFSAPRSPEVHDEVSSEKELGLRQAMAARTATAELMEVLAGQWLQGLWGLPKRRWHWGRPLLYATLCHLDPLAAVRTSERLLDVDLLRALFGNLNPVVQRWPHNLTDALLGSASAALRAVGCFAVAQIKDRCGHGNHLSPPDDVAWCVQRLRTCGVPNAEVAGLIALWAGSLPEPAKLAELARCVASLQDLPRDALQDFAAAALRLPSMVLAYVAHIRTMSPEAARCAEPVLDAMVSCFAAPLRCESEREPRFTGGWDMDRTSAIAAVAAYLAEARNTSVEHLVSSAVDFDQLRKHAFDPLTPLRRRKGALNAEIAVGWSMLWMTVAVTRPSEALVSTATEFLARPARRYLQPLREALGLQLNVPVAREDDLSNEDSDTS